MKAILVIDLDEDVLVDDVKLDELEIVYVIQDMYGNPVKAEVDGVKLKPMPEKVTIEEDGFAYHRIGNVKVIRNEVWSTGYNDCIDEILGETE